MTIDKKVNPCKGNRYTKGIKRIVLCILPFLQSGCLKNEKRLLNRDNDFMQFPLVVH